MIFPADFRTNVLKKIYSYRTTDKKRWGIPGDLTVNDVEEQLAKQEGRCYVCEEIVLLNSWTSRCLYQFSVDRINENFPHDRDNFLISCYHCNCTCYCREGSEKKICINGCHTEEKTINSKREKVLPLKEHLRLTANPGRDAEIKRVFEQKYLGPLKEAGQHLFKLRIEKRIMLQRLFTIFAQATKQLSIPTYEFMDELMDLRKRMHSAIQNYMCISNRTEFEKWFEDLCVKREINYGGIVTYSGTLYCLDEKRESSYSTQLMKKVGKELAAIYRRGSYELDPVYLIKAAGLGEYFSFLITV